MFRLLFRLIVVAVVLGAIAVFAVGYRRAGLGSGTATGTTPVERGPIDAGPSPIAVDADHARRAGAEIAGKVAESASRAGKALEESTLTAKIKSKITLDDTLDGADVSVSTKDTVVTLQGTVVNRTQLQRVLQLAKETAGVTSVTDKLVVREGR
jgi:hyperosmotically inducible protein